MPELVGDQAVRQVGGQVEAGRRGDALLGHVLHRGVQAKLAAIGGDGARRGDHVQAPGAVVLEECGQVGQGGVAGCELDVACAHGLGSFPIGGPFACRATSVSDGYDGSQTDRPRHPLRRARLRVVPGHRLPRPAALGLGAVQPVPGHRLADHPLGEDRHRPVPAGERQ